MPVSRDKRRKRGLVFIIALAALIFAETGFILGTTGLAELILPKPKVSFEQILSFSEAYIIEGGNETVGKPPKFDNAYVYVILYQQGTRLSENIAAQIAVDAAEKPVYILPLPIVQAPILTNDIIEPLPTNVKNPVVVLIYPLDRNTLGLIGAWLGEVENALGVRITGNVRIELVGNKPRSIRTF
ncbi:MAG: hypothetical protein QW610_06510 [Pyrobaculum sp.]